MICEAEKRAAIPAEPVIADKCRAISMRPSWETVCKLVDVVVPLRRPNPTRPTRTLKQETAAWEAASDEAWESIDDAE
jgi:hypothetical protein